jgi:hypothetical protein
MDTKRCTWSLDTCPFIIVTSCCPQMSRIRSRSRVVPTKSWPPIFRYPYQMQMDLEYGMRAVSVVRHPSSLICGARAEAVASGRGLEHTQTVTVTAKAALPIIPLPTN